MTDEPNTWEEDIDELAGETAGEAPETPSYLQDDPRWPGEDDPDPPGLSDPLSATLIAGARLLVSYIVSIFHGPASLVIQGRIWQRAKYELLDVLRPLELLLRRTLLIEAFVLITSQALPASAATRVRAGASRPSRPPARLDPARPESWHVSFRVIPVTPLSARLHQPSRKPGRKLPPVDPDHFRCDPIPPKRHRAVRVSAVALARRLEAAIRVALDPAPFARRLAFRLRRGADPKVALLIDAHPPAHHWRFARDALEDARRRALTLHLPWWSSG